MKKIFLPLLFGTAFSFLSTNTFAQTASTNGPTPSWVSNKGYWVIESNKHAPRESVVSFYNNDNLLVYKKEIRDQKLNLKRQKTLQQLKASLEDAVNAFENGMASNQPKPADKNW